jgi:hypothetical protein
MSKGSKGESWNKPIPMDIEVTPEERAEIERLNRMYLTMGLGRGGAYWEHIDWLMMDVGASIAKAGFNPDTLRWTLVAQTEDGLELIGGWCPNEEGGGTQWRIKNKEPRWARNMDKAA